MVLDKVGSGEKENTLNSSEDQEANRTAESPTVSVIIPHYNDLEGLKNCLDLLSRQTLSRDKFEVIVIDNNSSCGLDAVRAIAKDVAKVIQAVEQGAAAARNAGVAIARGTILAFIDSDCRPATNWLENGARAVATADIVGGRVNTAPADQNQLTPVEAFELIFAFKNSVYVNKVGFSVTANLFVKRGVFDAVGKFRPGLSEDKDWGLRAKDLGYRIEYKDDVVVAHPARESWPDLAKKWRRLTQEEYLLRQVRQPSKASWNVYRWIILFSPLLHIHKVLTFDGLNAQDKINAMKILFRIRFYRFKEARRIARNNDNARYQRYAG